MLSNLHLPVETNYGMHHILSGLYSDMCTCHGPKVVRIQMLLESFFGGLWDLRSQNAGGRANGDIIPAMKTQEATVVELQSEKDFLMMLK